MSTTTFCVPILNLDGQPDSSGESIDPQGVTFKPGPVPVNHEFDPKRLAGWATLSIKDGQVWADITAPEENHQLHGLFPAIGGVVLLMSGRTVSKCELREVGLSMKHNQDPRIPPIP